MRRHCQMATLLGVVAACSGAQPQQHQEVRRSPPPPAVQSRVVFGLEVGGVLGDAGAGGDHPAVVLAPDGSTPGLQRGTVSATLASLPVELELSVYEGRLSVISFTARGDNISVDAYERAAVELEDQLGDGASTRCVSEDGVSFEDYLRAGHGLLQTHWETETFWADLTLRTELTPASTLRLSGTIGSRQVTLPCDSDMICSGSPPRAPQEAKEGGAVGCSVDLSAAPPASAGGLPFGATISEVEASLGVTLEQGALSHSAPAALAGEQGRVQLSFYDGCLASYLFIIDGRGATVEAYRALYQYGSQVLEGEPTSVRCESTEGTPLMEHISSGRGLLETWWPETEAVRSSLRLHSLYGDRGEPKIVLEVTYLPLRPYAPRIDF